MARPIIAPIEPATHTIPRVASHDRPPLARTPRVLRAMAASWPAMHRWTLDRLRDAYADLPVIAARVDGGDVRMDPRHGLLHDNVLLGPFLDALRAGARDRYVMAPWAHLPRSLTDDAPAPRW